LVPAQYKSKTLSVDVDLKRSPSKEGLKKSSSAANLSPQDSPSQKKLGKASYIDKDKYQVTKEGVVIQKPEHLSNFTIDKPKIDFFK